MIHMKKTLLYSILILLTLLGSSSVMAKSQNYAYIFTNNYQFNQTTGNPEVTILNPANLSTVGDIVTIDVNASDPDGISGYAIYIDGNLVAQNTTYYWNTTLVSAGAHTIKAVATDTLGNNGTAVHVVTVDPNYTSGAFKFLAYNILETGAIPEWKEVIKEENPDIMVLVETGKWVNGSDEFNWVVGNLSSYFPNEHPYYAFTTKAVSSTDGEAILSRYPIINATQISTLYHDDGTPFEPAHDFLYAIVKIGEMYVHVFGTHLKCCSGGEASREEDIEGIMNFMDSLGNVPIIFAGDFNSFSPYDVGDLAPKPGNLGYGPISIMLNKSDPRASQVHQFYDVFRILNPYDPGYTYVDAFYRSRIDFIFVNQYFRNALVNSTVASTPSGKIGSDHYPVDAFFNLDFTTIDLRPPLPIHMITANILNDSAVELQWNSSNANDFDHYNLYRNDTLIAQTTAPKYNDTNLSTDTYYVYTVTPVDINGNEGMKSKELILVTNLGVMTLPGAPILNYTIINNKAIMLNWSKPAPEGFPVLEYRIYRGNGVLFKLWATTTSTNWTDTYVFPGLPYYYFVTAVNYLGEGEPSQTVRVVIPKTTTSTTSSSTTNTTQTSSNQTTSEPTQTSTTPTSTTTTPFSWITSLTSIILLPVIYRKIKKYKK